MMGLGKKHEANLLADEPWLYTFIWNASIAAGRENSFGAKTLLLLPLETKTTTSVWPGALLLMKVVRRCFLIR